MDPFEHFLEGFHRLPSEERILKVASWCGLDPAEISTLSGRNPLPLSTAEHFIENVIGVFPLPLGLATYFNINGKDVLIPMAVEETSIIAAVSSMAKWIRRQGGKIESHSLGRRIIGQLQIPRINNMEAAISALITRKQELIDEANAFVPGLVSRGGGIEELELRRIPRADGDGDMLVLHLLCNPCDAMGANLINQVCEGMKPVIEEVTHEKVGLCILSNLVDGNLIESTVEIPGITPEIGYGIQEATLFAQSDPYRASTHNKGVLNGIDPILIATGNDWRAVESGMHAYASLSGKYQPVSKWTYEDGVLKGRMVAPIAVGTVGGVTTLHPTARIALRILGVTHATELAEICGAVGLVQNLGALKALSTVGIVQGHMRLHTANLAMAAGATESELPVVRQKLSEILSQDRRINLSKAKEVLSELRGH